VAEYSDEDRWLSAKEIAALRAPGVPTTKVGVLAWAARDAWPFRARQGRSGGREYCVAQLPPRAQGAVRATLAARAAGALNAAPPAARARALLATAVLLTVELHLAAGMSFPEAKRCAAEEARPPVSLDTVERWWKRAAGLPPHERPASLLPRWKPGRAAEWTEAEERFYLAWRGLVALRAGEEMQQMWRFVAQDWASADGPQPSLDRCARRWRVEAPWSVRRRGARRRRRRGLPWTAEEERFYRRWQQMKRTALREVDERAWALCAIGLPPTPGVAPSPSRCVRRWNAEARANQRSRR
jgi:hypothetical protein